MNFRETMTQSAIQYIDSMVRTGSSLETAIERAKDESAAGPAVWADVILHYAKQKKAVVNVIKFEVGKTYRDRSICNHDCIFEATIISRTAKTVTVKLYNEIKRRRISEYEGVETFRPHGNYSMASIMRADQETV
jgi:hypothetical protein